MYMHISRNVNVDRLPANLEDPLPRGVGQSEGSIAGGEYDPGRPGGIGLEAQRVEPDIANLADGGGFCNGLGDVGEGDVVVELVQGQVVALPRRAV